MGQVFIGNQKIRFMKFYWMLWLIFILPSCVNKSLKNIHNQHTYTLFTEENWFLENYREINNGEITYVEKKIPIDSNLLSLQWEEKYDVIIGKAFFNRKITFNSYVFDFDKEHVCIYNNNVSEGLGFVSKDLIINEYKGFYIFYLILYDDLCTEDCYNYSVVECKFYKDKRIPPEFKIKEYISKKGIPKI